MLLGVVSRIKSDTLLGMFNPHPRAQQNISIVVSWKVTNNYETDRVSTFLAYLLQIKTVSLHNYFSSVSYDHISLLLYSVKDSFFFESYFSLKSTPHSGQDFELTGIRA